MLTPPRVIHCHTSLDPPTSTQYISEPPNFSITCIHTYVFTGGVVLVRGGLCPGFCPVLLSGRLCSGWFLSVPHLSEYIRYNRKLNITFNFRFHTCTVPPSPINSFSEYFPVFFQKNLRKSRLTSGQI